VNSNTTHLPCSRRCFAALAAVALLAAAAPALCAPPSSGAPVSTNAAAPAATIVLNQRPIVTLHATLLGRSPEDRVALGRAALQAALAGDGPGEVTVWLENSTAGLRVDGRIVFYLVPGDLESEPAPELAAAAEAVRTRLQRAALEVKETRDLHRISQGLAYSAAATLLAFALIWGTFALRRRVAMRLEPLLANWQSAHANADLVATYAHYARSSALTLTRFFAWALVLLLLDLWLTFVLRQFAYTRPWAERSTQWLLDVLAQFATAAAVAMPGVLIALLIFFIARLAARISTAFLLQIERGDFVVGHLDRDTAGPTRRIASFVIYLFALAMAYPFLPGSSSEAFKGVSVLAGLMLSLGASGVVGQIVSGLSLMYSRTLRAGEYVQIGAVEGTVTEVGMFATRVHTGLGEEVSVPNALVVSQAVRNFSRLVQDGQFVLHTAVTIGYTAPWRQVHALLLEAARRTPGVAAEPAPYVVQTALSDFYVEYRLCAQGDRSAPRRRIEAMNQLHANIQDVFNEHGVQIMSPHYRGDPPEPQVVPPGEWYRAPAEPPKVVT
jgi:small-conductance mechanosensitive channel